MLLPFVVGVLTLGFHFWRGGEGGCKRCNSLARLAMMPSVNIKPVKASIEENIFGQLHLPKKLAVTYVRDPPLRPKLAMHEALSSPESESRMTGERLQPSRAMLSPCGNHQGPNRPHKQKDLTIWLQGPM